MKLDPLNYFLDRITMYRLLLYILLIFAGIAEIFSFLKILPFNPIFLAFSVAWLTFVCYVANKVFSYVFEAPTNIESVYLTALILFLIIAPIRNFDDMVFMGWAGTLAIASKYILAINKKHIFNPAAIAVVITAFAINQSASWWIGTGSMFPFVLIGGLLIVKKIQRFDLVLSFVSTAVLGILLFALQRGGNPLTTLQTLFFSSPLLFFAFIMLTEPLTTPPTRRLRMLYAALVGAIFIPNLHIGSIYSTPEIALVLGNIFSYLVSPKGKFILPLVEKLHLAPGIYDFVFKRDKSIIFTPGQYMEWTLSHKNPDTRGNRRYFTLASSPTEDTIRLGVRFYEKPSSFKSSIVNMTQGNRIMAGNLAGDFILPKDKNEKLVFIAGGIGITPYRSILKYLLDTNEKRDIILLSINKIVEDIVYKDIFDQAVTMLGIKAVYTLTEQVPIGWTGLIGHLTPEMVSGQVSDFKDRTFYISGSHIMVTSCESALEALGIKKDRIKTDYFPGL